MPEKFVDNLNEKFAGQAKIIHMLPSEPTLKRVGGLSLSEEERHVSALIKNSIENLFEPVTKYGVLSQPSISANKDGSSILEYYDTDYAEICAKRRTAIKNKSIDDLPRVISACVVLFSKQKKRYMCIAAEKEVLRIRAAFILTAATSDQPRNGGHTIMTAC